MVIEGLPWARKLVDDIIVWATNIDELSLRINEITSRCEKANIILSKKKFVIGDEISFAGYSISKEGVKPDAARVKAIKDFPVPTDTTGVKSFLGLTNQLSFFIPDHIKNSNALRELCGRGVVFNWLPEHQFEFETIKTILSANLLNQHFDPTKPVFLLTDASRHHGLGFALC